MVVVAVAIQIEIDVRQNPVEILLTVTFEFEGVELKIIIMLFRRRSALRKYFNSIRVADYQSLRSPVVNDQRKDPVREETRNVAEIDVVLAFGKVVPLKNESG